MFTAICGYVDINIYSSVSCYSNIPSRYCPIVLRMQTTTNNLFVCFIKLNQIHIRHCLDLNKTKLNDNV